ncbi:hypothetical protein EZV62_015495 [Acer yangbiense]|uniref:DUF4218 domain-containing protein n=1 Tax=Acer yangbiense TaxID=1000413 RepID=A0A5C7HMX9_9ROSI|nr:hypothetical protein EZV62_015495 [Acer yangbiense]
MHIEKNICESVIGTLLEINGKTKNGINARKDLKDLRIRHELHPQDRGTRTYLPLAPHTLSKVEKRLFCKRLFDLKLQDRYSSNIGKCVSVEDCKLTGLKSHDCHVLMQQLMSVALRGLLPKGPRNAIYRLCAFFNRICQRGFDREEMVTLEDEVVETLCMLERYFPPSFFDIMVHLTIHLGLEVRLAGPVHYRWMYPFERHMKIFKGYVRNHARAEGCIVECYLADECIAFCSGYLKQTDEFHYQECRNHVISNDVIIEGRQISSGTSITLSEELLENAHRYIPFDDSSTSDELDTLKWLAFGPRKHAMRYSGYIINGYRFHTKDVERVTQNSGVSIEATTICRSSAKDTSQVVDVGAYYGVIKDIILLDYHRFQLPIFRCDWANASHGVKVEEGFTLVNLNQGQNLYEREPFILASQAKQVFYSRESDSSNWASKSRFVSKIIKAPNEQERQALQPDNIKSSKDWKELVKEKTSPAFQEKRKHFQAIKKAQIPHTTSRRGFARATKDLIRAHQKKNGEAVNTKATETIAKINSIRDDLPKSSSMNLKEDALAKVLGPENSGRVRGFGKGVTLSKLSILTQRDNQMNQMKNKYEDLKDEVANLRSMVNKLVKGQGHNQSSESCEEVSTAPITSPNTMNVNPLNKNCKILDWMGSGEIVVEGRWSSSDPKALVHHVPIGLNAMRVWVDRVRKGETFLWRPTSYMSNIEEAMGSTVAWPADKTRMDG